VWGSLLTKSTRLMVNIKHVTRKSDRSIVVRKFANKIPVSNNTKHSEANGAKRMERRDLAI
jgi:hypothetical protein